MPENNNTLSEQQVNEVLNAWNFLEFSNAYRGSYRNGYYTPDIVNQQLQNINMNPIEATADAVARALKNPKDSEEILRGYAQSLEIQNMYYKRLIRYFSDMASFNISFDPINVEKDTDLNSKEFKEDLRVLDNFCSRFNFKEEFGTVLRQLLRQGVFYSILRKSEDKYTLQELPPDFCKITGRFSHGLLFDFNMQWFIGNYGIDIAMYPKIFRRMYNDVFKKSKVNKWYNPAELVDERDSVFVYWHQCSPSDGFWAWKINPEIATIIPYFSAMFPEISYQPIIKKLQDD